MEWAEVQRAAEEAERRRTADELYEAETRRRASKLSRDLLRQRALRALGKLSRNRAEDAAVGRLLASVDAVRLLGAWTRFATPEGAGKAEAVRTARRCRRLWRGFGAPTLAETAASRSPKQRRAAAAAEEEEEEAA